MKLDIKNLLNSELASLTNLQNFVKSSIENENSLLDKLVNPVDENLTQGQKISDKVAEFGGSWEFIISFFVILVAWITFNSIAIFKTNFDPYPFILLNLVLSCLAAIQAPIIMMSQNRKEEKDRNRSQNDYIINLKAEIEIRALNQKIDFLQEEQMKLLIETQAQQMELLKLIKGKVKNL